MKQSFTSTESAIVISMGVISGCIAAIQPILLGGLLASGNLDVIQMGQAATFEALGMVGATTVAAMFCKPSKLRVIAFIALLVAMFANAATMFSSGFGVVMLRAVSGLCSGTLLWVLLGLLARSTVPARSFAVYVTSQSIISFLFSMLISNWLAEAYGAASGYALFAVVDLVLIFAVFKMPASYVLDEGAAGFRSPPLTGVLGLVAVGGFIASVMGFWVYVLPLGGHLGYEEGSLTAAVNVAIAAQIAAGICAIVLASKLAPFSVSLVGNIAILACVIAFVGVGGNTVLYASLIVFSFVWMFVPPFQLPLLMEFDPSLRAAMFLGTAQLSGVALGPIFVAQFISSGSISASVFGTYTLIAVATLFLFVARVVRNGQSAAIPEAN